MPIPVRCDCGRAIRVKDEHAGRRVRCQGCGTMLDVPAAAAPGARRAGPAARRWSGHAFADFSIVRVLLLLVALLSGLPATAGLLGTLRGAEPAAGWGTACLVFTMSLAGLAASRPRR